MLLAVLEARCGVSFAQHDVYLNVAGGLRIAEPAADLAVAAALISSRLNVALPADTVYFGEVSLSGAVRAVSHAPARLREAKKLGFGSAVTPNAKAGETPATGTGIGQLAELVARIAAIARSPVGMTPDID
jgi:DNA repair protein RadA/Sms